MPEEEEPSLNSDRQTSDVPHESILPVGSATVHIARSSRRRRGGRGSRLAAEPTAQPEVPVASDVPMCDVEGAASIARGSRRRGSRCNRLWCHVYLDPLMLEPGFDLVKKIIGRSGCNTRKIFEATQTNVRVRGRGSGHKEHHNGREAPVPLMIALAAEHGSSEDFKSAFRMTKQLLHDVSKRFEGFLQQARPQKRESAAVGCRFWVGETSEMSKMCLGELLDGVM